MKTLKIIVTVLVIMFSIGGAYFLGASRVEKCTSFFTFGVGEETTIAGTDYILTYFNQDTWPRKTLSLIFKEKN